MDRGTIIFVVLLAVIAVLAPVLNLAVPPTSPFNVSTYSSRCSASNLLYALLALGANLILGHADSCRSATAPSLRSAATRMGMYLMRQIGTRASMRSDPAGLHGVPELAGAAVYWYGFQHFFLCPADGGAGAGVLAFVSVAVRFRRA